MERTEEGEREGGDWGEGGGGGYKIYEWALVVGMKEEFEGRWMREK
jgi:hypothetical protein